MKRYVSFILLAAVIVAAGFFFASRAQESGDQNLLNLSFLKGGASSQGARTLATGEVSTLSAAVASATRAQVVAAPASGSIYLRGILIETATNAAGIVTVTQGTGTNCATSPVVLFALGIGTGTSPLPVGVHPVGIQLPAAKALCLTTDAATTSARALYQ